MFVHLSGLTQRGFRNSKPYVDDRRDEDLPIDSIEEVKPPELRQCVLCDADKHTSVIENHPEKSPIVVICRKPNGIFDNGFESYEFKTMEHAVSAFNAIKRGLENV